MNTVRRSPLSVGPIRALEAVARHLNFRASKTNSVQRFSPAARGMSS